MKESLFGFLLPKLDLLIAHLLFLCIRERGVFLIVGCLRELFIQFFDEGVVIFYKTLQTVYYFISITGRSQADWRVGSVISGS